MIFTNTQLQDEKVRAYTRHIHSKELPCVWMSLMQQ